MIKDLLRSPDSVSLPVVDNALYGNIVLRGPLSGGDGEASISSPYRFRSVMQAMNTNSCNCNAPIPTLVSSSMMSEDDLAPGNEPSEAFPSMTYPSPFFDSK